MLGLNLQKIWMTMFALVAVYLVIAHAGQVNTLVTSTGKFINGNLVVLQGRDPRRVL